MPEKGVIHLLPLLLVLVGLAALAVVVFRSGAVKITQKSSIKEPTVQLTESYQNPFDKTTQYVNPFSEYKNPFDNL